MDAKIEKTMQSLIKNNIKPYFAETKQEVVPLITRLLRDGDTVSAGGSMSLFACGVIEYLRCGRYRFLDRYEPDLSEADIRSIYLRAMDADAYFCSSNAVTENGELYNVDGNANRISAISYGPKSVIMVVGKNKIVPDLEEAVKRVKSVTAPQICRRRGSRTYCRETGYCIAIANGQTEMTSGCDSAERRCCTYLVTGRQRVKDRIKVILVNEGLGY